MPMVLVATVTVSAAGGATAIEFLDIPQSGKDLLLFFNHRGTAAGSFWTTLQTNGQAGAQYRNLNGSGSTATSQNSNGHGVTWVESEYPTTSTWHSMQMLIPEYTLSTATKTISVDTALVTTDSRQFGTFTAIITGRTAHTTAISSLSLVASSNGFAQNSSASLYLIT